MATTFYATNNFTGDGTTVNWNINFADGYIDLTNVKARYLDNTGSYVDIAISSVAGNVVTISPAVANGQEFQIYRDTEKRFPLVDFSDGAILNETNLDTLATQAVMVSAEAFDQSNNGVRIAGDSLVVAQGIDAKAQLALDNSDAAVATANAIDGKAQTALDNAATAVATANAATSTAAGAVATANTALSTANDAADDAATAITTANGAVTTANAATTTANAASAAASAATTTANNAANDAATAVSTAGTALSTANTASTNASTAVTTANDAKATAEGIEAKADSALAASATAVSTANSAEATANAIDGKATDALNTADSAVVTANAATTTANAASSTASSAATDASTALSTANAIDAKAQTALDNTTALDAATMKKAANLSDIADKAAAWLNVRPVGSTPLASDPVDALDAATKQWVEARRAVSSLWSVVEADAVRPPNSTIKYSGVVSAEYKVGGVIEAQSKVYTAATIGGKYSTQLSVKNATSGKEKDISVTEDGDLRSDRFKARFGTLMAWSETGLIQGTYSVNNQQVGQNYAFNSTLSYSQEVDSGYRTATHHGLIHNNNGSFAQSTWLVAGDSNAQYLTRMNIQPNSHDIFFSVSILGSDSFYTLQKSAISDANVKHDIAPGSVDTAWSNLVALQYVTFVYNNDEQARTRRGIIAQQAEVVDPLYVKTITYYKSDGTPVEQKQLDTTPMLLDTMHVVQTLMAKVEALEARIDELTSQ